MSIANEFDSTIENIKSDYEGLENLGADLTNVNKNIQNIRTCLDTIYDNLPKTTGEGSNLSLTTLKGRINTEAYKGDTTQEGTPTPSNVEDINVVTGTQEVVVQNRNLLAGIEYGEINAQTGAEASTTAAVRSANFIPYQLNTKYYGSVNGAELPSGLNLRFYNKNKEYIGYTSSTLKGAMNLNFVIATSVADTTPRYIKFRCALNTGVITSIDDKVLISTTNDYSYVEHQEQTKTLHLGDIELCKIGTYQDRIYKNNGKWYIEKKIGKVVLNGNFADGGIRSIFYTTTITDYATNNNIPYSQYYKGVSNVVGAGGMNEQDNNTIGFINQSGSVTPRFYVKDSRYDHTQPSQLNTWLNTHNLIVYYVLSTPTYTEITNTTLLEELNELEKIMSYSSQTNISVSGNLPMILEVSALKGE